MNKLRVKYIPSRDMLVINDIKYSGEFFRSLALVEVGTYLELTKREDDMITLIRLSTPPPPLTQGQAEPKLEQK